MEAEPTLRCPNTGIGCGIRGFQYTQTAPSIAAYGVGLSAPARNIAICYLLRHEDITGVGMKKDHVEKLVLLLLILAGAVYAYITYFLLPRVDVIKGDLRRLAERKTYYAVVQSYAADLSGLQRKIDTVKNQVNRQAQGIPSRLDKPQIMVDLYQMAKARGVYPQTLKFEPQKSQGSYEEMALTFTCLGNPGDVLNLLQDLQQYSKQKFAITSTSLVTEKGVMTAELKLNAYAVATSSTSQAVKLDFMNAPLGMNSTTKLFSQ